jgi:glutaredoxin 3
MYMKIRVFSTPTCPYCVVLKNFLKENGFEYEDIDVSQSEEAQTEMIEKTGQMGVPVTDIDGEWIIGFDQVKIKELLGL